MKLFAAREEDAHQGWVWLQDSALPHRCVVKITNTANGHSVYCEALQIESNFLSQYNQSPRYTITDPKSSLVIGAWFRAGLGGVESQTELSLKVQACWSWWSQFRACTDHPQVVVRLAAWLGGLGFVFGLAGLILGLSRLGTNLSGPDDLAGLRFRQAGGAQ
jgi:thiosulfate reductase cytochrome b subunit